MLVHRGVKLALLLFVLPFSAGQAEEPVDLDAINRIRHEGFHRSQVMETMKHLVDVIGPRLTGSPGMLAANDWTREQLEEWGLSEAHLEGFEFGRGWSFERASVHLVRPRKVPLFGLPEGWTPGTRKPLRGTVTRLDAESKAALEAYRGKLKGRLVLLDEPRAIEPPENAPFRRYSEEDLGTLETFNLSDRRRRFGDRRGGFLRRWEFRRFLQEFLAEEEVLATLKISSRDQGLIRVGGTGAYEPGEPEGVPSLVLAAEHYNYLYRLLEEEMEVELEIDVRARFHDEDTQAYNTLAEIPGSDLADEVVMLGGHLDSWHGSAGATDNAAGCAVAMEAVRILQALELKPRRTIRIALWSAEEQGLRGSRAYVKSHFATRPESDDPEAEKLPRFLREQTWPIEVKPAHETFSAYFNLDNGSGKIRGIYAQENVAAVPIFRAWLAPFADLGADTVTLNNTGGTDHLAFDGVGLPGFQFIQDQLDYFAHTHHTNMDTLDHVQEKDLMQASVIMAAFVYHAAMRDERMPRKPMPRDPSPEPDEDEDERQGAMNATAGAR